MSRSVSAHASGTILASSTRVQNANVATCCLPIRQKTGYYKPLRQKFTTGDRIEIRRFRHQGSVQVKAGWFGDSEKSKDEEKKEEAEQASESEGGTKNKYSKLLLAVLVDSIGLLVDKSFLDFDFGWSPVAAFIIQRMYNAPLLTAVGLVEQVIPGVNYLPTATLGWVAESYPQLEWVTKLPFMGALGKSKEKGLFGWPFGGKKD